MTAYVTSDLHFFHKNAIKYSQYRPYETVEEMNRAIIDHINSKCKVGDKLYILGDVSFGKFEQTRDVLLELNPCLVLIEGNHDKHLMKNPEFRRLFVDVDKIMEISHNGINIVMCHFPIMEWNCMHRGWLHLHGHMHGAPTGLKGRLMDVGWDTEGKIFTLDEVVERLEKIEIVGRYSGGHIE